MNPDTRWLRRRAADTAASLARESANARPPGRVQRLWRALARARQGLARRVALIVREHWDVGAFDVLFGSVKAFGVYPALYFAGYAWTIPLMEYVPLNTQLWTAGYLLLRREVRSELGRRRYGHPLKALDALRDRLLRPGPADARDVHRFEIDGAARVLRVRRSRLRAWLARRRGVSEPGVVSQSELRGLVGDPELLFRANPLRANPYLYEEVLLASLLEKPHARERLLPLSLPEEPDPEESGALRAIVDDTHEPARARVTEQARALATSLRERFGRAPCALAVRWTHAGLRRRIRRELAALDDAQYRVLADRAEGRPLTESPHWRALCEKRAEVRAWIARAGRFAARAAAVTNEDEAWRLAREGVPA